MDTSATMTMPQTGTSTSSANILVELGLENLPEEEKATILDQLMSLVQKRVMVRILDALTDDQKEEMGALLEKNGGDADAVSAWLGDKVPNLPNIVAEETETVKTELLSSEALKGV